MIDLLTTPGSASAKNSAEAVAALGLFGGGQGGTLKELTPVHP